MEIFFDVGVSALGNSIGPFVRDGISTGVEVIQNVRSQSDAIDDKLDQMQYTLSTVLPLVHDTVEAQINYEEWQNFLQEFEDVGYDVEDLMDLKKMGLRNKLSEHGIDGVETKLKNISEKLVRLQNDKVDKPTTTSTMGEDDCYVLGRETDLSNIVAILEKYQPSFSIISILGIVGVGKTTLARQAYNYDSYKKPFPYKVWVSVPIKFNALTLMRFVLDEVITQSPDHISSESLESMESLQRQLKKLLHKKKLLLILDGVCNFNKGEWDPLLTPLKDISVVSKIIVTTASPVVSKQLVRAYRSKQYDLKCLGDEDCWQVLKKALGGIDVVADPKLELVGKELAKKCKGLPLAAKVVGGLFGAKVEEWESILHIKMSDNHEIEKQIVPAVRWGYCGLPFPLRQTFTYCSMFPSCYAFDKDKIIKMWMAEGLMIPHSRERLEDTGSSYINQLLENLFFQNNDSKYMIQDSVHEIAQSVFGKRPLELGRADNPCKSTRLLLTCKNIQLLSSSAPKVCLGIRTLLLPGAYPSRVDDARLKEWDFEKLRVLDLSGTQITELTARISTWKHLRFLDLSNTHLKRLPPKIVALRLLQTLRLVNCLKLLYLPADIGNLENLRHLELGGNNQLSSMPCGIGNLTNLQTINEFIVSPKGGQLKELGNMNSIRGSLCIKQLEKAQDSGTESEANLSAKKHLDKLELQWSMPGNADKSQKVLGHLMNSPHESLKELVLKNYGGSSFPGWISDPSSLRLTTIYIYHCPNCIILPCLGNLPNLKSLKIIQLPKLEMVDNNFLGHGAAQKFQRLEILEFQNMPGLKSWAGLGDNDMTLLHTLIITNCPSLTTIPPLHRLQHLKKLDFKYSSNLKTKDYFTDEQLRLQI